MTTATIDTMTPQQLTTWIARCHARGLEARFWDVAGPEGMTELERNTPAYDYRQQCWTTADHAHIDPVSGDSAFCGTLISSCAIGIL